MTANRKPLIVTTSLALFLAIGIAHGRAAAQSFLTPAEVQDCICREQALQSMRQENAGLQIQINNARAQLQDLQSKIDNMRATMNPNDTASVRTLSQMIQQRDALNNQYRSTVFAEAWASTSRLNAAIDEYNQRCTQRSMRNIDVETAKNNMAACPPAP
jgi:TolA-binding protein